METNNNSKIKARAGSVLTVGWNMLWDKFITLFLISLVITVAFIPFSAFEGVEGNPNTEPIFGVIAFLYFLFMVSPLSVSQDYLYLKGVRGLKIDVKELFDVFKNYLNVVLACLLKHAITGIGFAFFIVPGIIFACRLVFVPYLVMDKKYDAVKAVEESWRITKGYGWRIFWLKIVSFFLFIGGIIVFIFGVLIAIMWINATFAALYQAVLDERGENECIEEPIETTPVAETEIINQPPSGL